MLYLSKLTKNDLNGKRCLLRINLDVTEPKESTLRLSASVPTIKFLLENGATPIIFGHRGRPDGEDSNLSVEPSIKILEKKIGQKLEWLENMRFDSREQACNETLAEELSKKGDIFINDDFATLHHRNSSFIYLPKYLPSYVGLLLEKELEMLTKARDNAERPLVVILGGIKFEDKVGVISYLKDGADNFLMGGAYLGLQNSEFDSDKVVLPDDVIGDNLDIGPETIKKYQEIIKNAKTIIWNGPLGKVEESGYRNGSLAIAQAIIDSGAFSVIGGGDTEQFIDDLGLKSEFSFISTGGGAMLAFLANKEMPGLSAMKNE